MPKLSPQVKRFVLPSTKGSEDEAWVDIITNPLADALISGAEGKSASEQTLLVVAASIKDWNLTDEKGEKVSVTPENIRKGMLAADYVAIINEMNFEGIDISKKKT